MEVAINLELDPGLRVSYHLDSVGKMVWQELLGEVVVVDWQVVVVVVVLQSLME